PPRPGSALSFVSNSWSALSIVNETAALTPFVPLFWRPSEHAARCHRAYLTRLLAGRAATGYRTENALLFAVHGGDAWTVDDAQVPDGRWTADPDAAGKRLGKVRNAEAAEFHRVDRRGRYCLISFRDTLSAQRRCVRSFADGRTHRSPGAEPGPTEASEVWVVRLIAAGVADLADAVRHGRGYVRPAGQRVRPAGRTSR
ncbi:hypothetical protein, partial [Jatrophihabitans endophyticus]|uniref:hypothetical protein n=1 Tax=Jatrophihabitans endophyticus TaxID=1206085 RepID=UPI0019FB2B59